MTGTKFTTTIQDCIHIKRLHLHKKRFEKKETTSPCFHGHIVNNLT